MHILAASSSIHRVFSPRYGLAISGTRFEDQPPQAERLTVIAALFGQHGEVAQGQMAVDALIDAAETVGTLKGQDPPPAGFGLGRLAGFAMQDGLAEMQLGVVGVDGQARGTGPSTAGRSPSIWWQRAIRAKVCARSNRSGPTRAGSLKIAQGGRPVPPLDGCHSQVEEHERVVGPLGSSASRIFQSRCSFRCRRAGLV